MSTSDIILLTGGIGAGKSVVARCLRVMGYTVYDSDQEARRIMDNSQEVRQMLRTRIHPGAVRADGTIDRAMVAEVVFRDPARLAVLNDMVHALVRDDIHAHATQMPEGCPLFVETAIPRSSHLEIMARAVWEVTSPEDVRIRRVQARSHLSAEHIRRRIAAQAAESVADAVIIPNDGVTPVLPRLLTLLQNLR